MTARDPDRILPPLLLALTAVTGLVDAVSFLSLGHVFTANMTKVRRRTREELLR